jgi:hypothetical protein
VSERVQTDIKGDLVRYMDGSKTNIGSGAEMYRWGLRTGYGFNLGLHTTIYQAEIYMALWLVRWRI